MLGRTDDLHPNPTQSLILKALEDIDEPASALRLGHLLRQPAGWARPHLERMVLLGLVVRVPSGKRQALYALPDGGAK